MEPKSKARADEFGSEDRKWNNILIIQNTTNINLLT